MAVKEFAIKEFKGIDQSKSENALDPGASPDARNIDTENGGLMVARGYVKHLLSAVPGTGDVRRLYIWRDLVTIRYIVAAGREVYAYVTTDATPQWKLIFTYPEKPFGNYPAFEGLRWDFLEARIGSVDYLIIANGEHQLIKWDGLTASAQAFGTAAKQSEKPVNFLEMHYNRLFSAGNRDYPTRLYWSSPPGDTRTIEDWAKDEASENASGGHVEVGDTSKDPIVGLCSLSNQLLIFKRASIYRLLGDRPSNYRIYRVYSEVEEMADSSLVIYGDTPFWMTSAGMYYHDGQSSMPIYNARNIQHFLKGARLTMSKSCENRDRLYFTCRTGDNESYLDNAVIVYDVKDKTYMVRDGFAVADICSQSGVLYMVNDKRYVYRFDEGRDYDGGKINAYWKTPLTDMDKKPGIKALKELYLRGEGDILLIDATIGKNTTFNRYRMPDEPADVLEVPLINEGRVLSFRFRNEEGSFFRIEGGIQVMFEERVRTM